jgi:hypothetical protein
MINSETMCLHECESIKPLTQWEALLLLAITANKKTAFRDSVTPLGMIVEPEL